MMREEFLSKFEAEAGCRLLHDHPDRVVALAKLHRGGRLLTDLSLCRGMGLSFGEWLQNAEHCFPVHEDMAKDKTLAEIKASLMRMGNHE